MAQMNENIATAPVSPLRDFFAKPRIIARPGFNRWLVPPAALADYLSGLLIGHELVSGLAGAGDLASVPLVMIGAPALCERYAQSLRVFGKTADAVLDNTAPVGLWNLALAAGLVSAN